MKLISKSWVIPFETKHELNDIKDGSNGVLRADFSAADKSIQNLCGILTGEGWEIKSVIPLISGMVFGTALVNKEISIMNVKSYGGGYGYGASFTEGVIVLAQKWVEENNDQLKEELLKKDSFPDDHSSILDLRGFEDNTNIHQPIQSKCPMCKNDLIHDESDPNDIYWWCPNCQKKIVN